MLNPFLMLSQVIARFRTNKNKDIEDITRKINKLSGTVGELAAQISVINKNIIVLDENFKQLNAVSEIVCAVQQQILDDMEYGASNNKKVHIFPFGKPKDDDLPN